MFSYILQIHYTEIRKKIKSLGIVIFLLCQQSFDNDDYFLYNLFMSYIILNKSETVSDVVDYLIEHYGLPTLQMRLNIYSADNNNLSIEVIDNNVYFIGSEKNKPINIKNKNLKQFFRHIQDYNKHGFFINDIVFFNFSVAKILFNTYHGDILSTNDNVLVDEICAKFDLEHIKKLDEHKPIFMTNPENLFDNVGNLNEKIKKYSNLTGLDIRSNSGSMKIRLSNLSNDYTAFEKYFKLITKNELLSADTNIFNWNNFKNISIIIPIYNQTIIPTLLSIQGQNLPQEKKKMIQVIIVNDGSKSDVSTEIESIKNKIDFEIDVIEFKNNLGLSNARNTGLAIAKYDLLLFMDSDIILSKNYLYDINIRLQIMPNSIFVAMRKNIDNKSKMLKSECLLKGVERSLVFDDSRVTTISKDYHIGWDVAYKNECVNILDDTNYFKQLSFGAKIGIYDLPSVVTGHNIAVNKKNIDDIQIFPTMFRGWGFEDTYFAAKLIAKGCFVVPVISSSVYHIDHAPRSGSLDKKIAEAKVNFDKYNSLLNEKWEV